MRHIMDKKNLLKNIAETGYNVGIGAKKHFATYDIVDKMPGAIGFVSTSFGIYALIFDGLSSKFLSASFAVLGIIGLYITFYDSQKSDYEKVGILLTTLFNELRDLYRNTQSSDDSMIPQFEQKLRDIEERYYASSKSKQILFSDWYAHYKFFWQHQIDWVDEQKKFKLLRDKIPLTFSMTMLATCVVLLYSSTNVLHVLCSLTQRN
jgi:SMODS and SLOG-associating 2TM effector domain 6